VSQTSRSSFMGVERVEYLPNASSSHALRLVLCTQPRSEEFVSLKRAFSKCPSENSRAIQWRARRERARLHAQSLTA
jgi:hypothetical protein